MKELTARLRAVAEMVRPGSRVADIGTDHALLPVWLLQSGRCPAAVASDIGEGPASSARHTVETAGLTARIAVRVGDGLAPVSPDEAEDIVIAGMGGETIAAILEAAPWVRDARYHLVLQPMSKPERLRRFLFENGFAITHEDVIAEGERLYDVMSVTFTGMTRSATLADCILGGVPHTPAGMTFLQKQRNRLAEAFYGCPDTAETAARRAALSEAIRQLDDWIKET